MAEYSYSKELEMWNRQNQYNAPESQMNRFKEAGLNPNLIYGQGNAGNATTMPKFNAPTLREKTRLPDMTGVLPSYQDYKLKEANVDIANQQARLIEEKVATESFNRAMASFKWFGGQQYGTFGMFQTGDQARYHDIGVQKWRQSYEKSNTAKNITELSNYNWQIAKQNLQLREKDNQYYFMKNMGPMIGRGLGNASRLFRKGKVGAKLKSSVPKKLTPRGQFFRDTKDMLPNYNF